MTLFLGRASRGHRWAAALFLVFLFARSAPAQQFRRGDADASGSREVTDGIRILLHLFSGGEPPPCLDAADLDDDGSIVISDAVYLLNFLFSRGPEPPGPFLECGLDPTEDTLGCAGFAPCELDEFEDLVASFDILDTMAGAGALKGEGVNEWQPAFEGGPAKQAELSTPHNALGDDAGNIYIADKDAHAIRKIVADGTIHTVAGTNVAGDDGDEPGPGAERALDEPNGLWVRGDGTVYILDTGNAKVRRLSPQGEMTTLFEVPGLATGRGLWVSDDEETAFVSSRTVLVRWTRAGGVEAHASGFAQLGNIAVDREGNVIATDRDANKVYRVTPAREKIHIAGNGTTAGGGDGSPALETGLAQVRGVWVLENGGYFLATQSGSQIWYVDTQGIIHLFLDGGPNAEHAGDGEPFDTPGKKVSQIRNGSMDRQGNLLITENDFGFVRIIHRKGPS
jgi:hypothetical protein